MNIPNYENVPVIEKGGVLTAAWSLILQQLISELQKNLSNEGYIVPQQPTATITMLNTTASTGALLYDSDTDELKVNIAGTFRVVQVV